MSYRTLSVLLMSLVLGAAPASAQAQPAPPPGLPRHFAFGLSAGQGDTWMPESQIKWDYRFQYLAGGANTGQGWETWNPSGTFALNYAQESARNGYIPMFPYYELLQSRGSCGNCDENRKDLSNVNDAALMRAYYDNFALLMKRLGPGTYDAIKGFGSTALVLIEPDFTGGYAVQAANRGTCFGFCTGRGNDPSLVKAAVGSSGHADVAGYPDTIAGYAQALAHLRDLYAPNVLLGHNVSAWASGTDIGLDTDPNTDASGLGQQVGAFLAKLGPQDVIFTDPLDRDAGQYKVEFGQNRWWDRLNQKFPNFARWEQYVYAASQANGSRPVLLWQVPAGNQYFQTVNNTKGHYQDNRAEYLFSHIPELIQANIVGVLFAPGNAGGTTWADTSGDGITNPPPFCTTDGISSGQICNDHPSSVPDDDGGFIRMSGQAYYQSPVALDTSPPMGGGPISAPSPPPATPAPTPAPAPSIAARLQVQLGEAAVDPSAGGSGQDVIVRQDFSVNSDTRLLVDFELYDAQGNKVWQTWHDELPVQAGAASSDSAVFSVPPTLGPGQYVFKAGVFSAGWGTMYAWNDNAGTLTVHP